MAASRLLEEADARSPERTGVGCAGISNPERPKPFHIMNGWRPASGPVIRFSTEDLPEKDRLDCCREECGRSYLKADFEQFSDTAFTCLAYFQNFPGLSTVALVSNGFSMSRTSELIADGNDNYILNIPIAGSSYTSQVGQEVVTETGQGLLISSSDRGTVIFPRQVKYLSLSLPRTALGALAANPEAALMKSIPRENEALRLLRAHFSILNYTADSGAGPQLGHAFAEHVLDLTALAVGATRDGMELAKSRGLRAARLCAIKMDIMDNLDRSDLSVAFVAARHGVTPRYVQMLFEAEGITFSQFVMSRRLARVHRRLADGRFAHQSIGDVIEQTGIGDSSHFHRAFRRRYGASPSEVRSAALRPQGTGESLITTPSDQGTPD